MKIQRENFLVAFWRLENLGLEKLFFLHDWAAGLMELMNIIPTRLSSFSNSDGSTKILTN
jgi:hypothetical protein